jgi:DNA-binding NtrC family response regulator
MSEQPDGKTRLLIADDDTEIRNILEEFLCGRYECRAVGSAAEMRVKPRLSLKET